MLEYLELLNLGRECDVCLGPYLCNALGTPLEMFQVFKEFVQTVSSSLMFTKLQPKCRNVITLSMIL